MLEVTLGAHGIDFPQKQSKTVHLRSPHVSLHPLQSSIIQSLSIKNLRHAFLNPGFPGFGLFGC